MEATDPDAWRKKAKCRDTDPNLFIPNGPGDTLPDAIKICHGWDGRDPCPVRLECHAAGEAGDEYGVWGGQMRSQRGVRIIVPLQEIRDARPRRA